MGSVDDILFRLGPIGVSRGIATTWALTALLGLGAALATLRLRVEGSKRTQVALEGIVLAMRSAIAEIAPAHADRLLPFIGTLWVFIVAANLVGIIPGLHSPTGSLSITAALACVVFLAVHWYGIRISGWRTYLRHYVTPSPVLLPFHLISELTRTLALAVRLFGNIMSLEMAALLVLLVAGLLVPIPLLMLHVIEALVQAYIFGVLALVYVGSALHTQQERQSPSKE